VDKDVGVYEILYSGSSIYASLAYLHLLSSFKLTRRHNL
jgi:hypothetical protein